MWLNYHGGIGTCMTWWTCLTDKDNSRKFLLLPACSKTQDMGCLWQMLQCTHMRPSLLHLQTIEDCHKNLAMSTWPKYFECVGHRRITRETGHSSEAGQQTSFQCYLLLLGSASALPRSLLLINPRCQKGAALDKGQVQTGHWEVASTGSHLKVKQ